MTVATLGELGKLVEGVVRGTDETRIENALPLKGTLPNACITLVERQGAAELLSESGAIAAVVPLGFSAVSIPVIEVRNPHAAFEQIIMHFRPPALDHRSGVHVHAVVDPTASIGEDCVIAAGASVGPGVSIGARTKIHGGVHVMANCTIGNDCVLYPSVVLYPETRVGDRCLVHSGTVLGAFGFGYRTAGGKHQRSAQLGWVELGDDVELGACVTIDRGTYGPTRIGTGSKLDNQVMIGHNCQIGRHNLICAQVGIAGSSTTGDYVVLAGQVGIKDHIHLADRAVVAAQSGVMHNIPEGEVWSGYPAQPTKKNMQGIAAIARLPEMRSELRQLEQDSHRMQQEIKELRDALATHTQKANPKAA